MSGVMDWLRAHPAWRAGAAGLVASAVLLALAHGRGVAVSSRDVVAPAATPAMTPSSPTPSATAAPPDTSTAATTARSFLVAYFGSDDAPEALRARLRPYDTDHLDAELAEGAAGGAGASDTGAIVGQPDVLGLAPDGRLVVTDQIAVDGATRYVELYLATTAAGWRVDEVAL